MPELNLAEAVTDLGKAFEAFKETHTTELAEIKKNGAPDPVTSEKLAKIEAELDKLEAIKADLDRVEAAASRPRAGSDTIEVTPAQKAHVDAFEAWLRAPNDGQKAADLNRAALEAKAVSSATTSAGYAIPEIIGSRIAETLQQESPMRSVLDVITVGSSDYKELVDVNGETSGWLGETDARTGTATPQLEQAVPTMGEIYNYPQVYDHILEDAFFDVQGWLTRKVVAEHARREGEAFISGDGVNKPTGFLSGTPEATPDFPASRGFDVLEYIPSGDAAAIPHDPSTDVYGDDLLLDMVSALRPRFRQGAAWLMNTTMKGAIRKWRTKDGDLLMRMGMEAGEGMVLFGYPIQEMDHMPDVAANAFPIAFGNFREAYLAVERSQMRITIDDNITSPGSVKFYVRRRVGGAVRQGQAIKLLKVALT